MFECYEDYQKFVSKRISQLREQKGVSARDMSLSLGLAAGYINNIENSNNMPSMKGFYYICEFLKVEPHDFFESENEAPELILELVDELKKLDRKALISLLGFLKSL